MTDEPTNPVVLCYDGSDVARHAIRTAGRVLVGRTAVVLSVYTINIADLLPGVDVHQRAHDLAQAGANIAREAGFEATGIDLDTPTIWKGLVDYAEEHNAEVVVAGTTGMSALSTVLGSVAYGVAHHCTRPVLLVRPDR